MRENKKIFLVAFIFLLVGIFIGYNKDAIYAFSSPIFGVKVSTDSIDLSLLQKTYKLLAANYDGKIDKTALINSANKGMVNALGDKYTIYMTAKEASEFGDSLTGDIGGGIGAEIGMRDNKPTIVDILSGDPAEKVGIKANDIIIDINDESVSNWTLDKVISKVRGDIGTTVKLTIERDNSQLNFSVTRESISNPSVSSKVEDNIGIITISRFGDDTSDLVIAAANKFKSQNVKGVIVDLRDNGGGYLTAAKDVAGVWLNNKTVTTERVGNKITDDEKTDSNAILNGVKTVVVVNKNTASASEILSGALQDYGVATIVGESTYGKGCVQNLFDLGSGAELKVTIAKWYTPNGKNIMGVGITPNTKIDLTKSDVSSGTDTQLNKAKELINQ
jgi:carboxyl-terminal processing protease